MHSCYSIVNEHNTGFQIQPLLPFVLCCRVVSINAFFLYSVLVTSQRSLSYIFSCFSTPVWYYIFLTNYDVARVERKTAEYEVISSFVKKPGQNREKSTNGDYLPICRKLDNKAIFCVNIYSFKFTSQPVNCNCLIFPQCTVKNACPLISTLSLDDFPYHLRETKLSETNALYFVFKKLVGSKFPDYSGNLKYGRVRFMNG